MSSATPFRKILVANRGEIALRVMRTAAALGYRCVAVHSTADAHARHVREADEAVAIGGPLPAESYLRIDALIDAARRTGADAIHPGYGFLAESAPFAQACRDAGLVFIGPSAEAIAAMGHKAGAKRRMSAAGVPCIPGDDGRDQDPAALRRRAAEVGYPLMIKASAGGGGRGMRRVAGDAEFADQLGRAKSEALHAFGDDHVILERALDGARHVEIQVVADRHGHVIHLGERDCSVQRRHQKLIEEAPSPAVSGELRERMGAAAVAAARAIGYEGVGTLEFLLDVAGGFYFMEMNTRLQVEHPVTEAVTGLDLVELQLRVAAGEPLPLTQADVRWRGHAIEVRLCAEDPAAGFLPQVGTVTRWRMPEERLRVEDALRDGDTLAPYYDSMAAKLIAHGATRDAARQRLVAGLQDALVFGVATNQALLAACLSHPVFGAGGATTAFIDDHLPELLTTDAEAASQAAALAALLLACGIEARPPAYEVPLRLAQSGRMHDVRVAPAGRGQGCRIEIDRQHERAMTLLGADAERLRYLCDGVEGSAPWQRDGDTLWLHLGGRSWRVEDHSRRPVRRHADAGHDGSIRASMSGRVVALRVALDEFVEAGQPVLVLEAMKMEHVHTAPVGGRVGTLHVAVGDQVDAAAIVARIERSAPSP